MFTPGRFQIRTWMFIYLGLVAAIVLAEDPINDASSQVESAPGPAMIVVDSPLRREDI